MNTYYILFPSFGFNSCLKVTPSTSYPPCLLSVFFTLPYKHYFKNKLNVRCNFPTFNPLGAKASRSLRWSSKTCMVQDPDKLLLHRPRFVSDPRHAKVDQCGQDHYSKAQMHRSCLQLQLGQITPYSHSSSLEQKVRCICARMTVQHWSKAGRQAGSLFLIWVYKCCQKLEVGYKHRGEGIST